jgi:predicted Holliday junction resolvase-like endonuclease
MVALLLAILVIWCMILFCGVVVVAMIALVNRLNELSRHTLPRHEEINETLSRDEEQDTNDDGESMRNLNGDSEADD